MIYIQHFIEVSVLIILVSVFVCTGCVYAATSSTGDPNNSSDTKNISSRKQKVEYDSSESKYIPDTLMKTR
jgi:hypothetical protein